MKIPNSVFCILLAAIAYFYIVKGNDMHKEKIPITQKDQKVITDK